MKSVNITENEGVFITPPLNCDQHENAFCSWEIRMMKATEFKNK